MATRYARNVTGNWNDLNSWSDTGSGGDAGTDYAKAGDVAIFDSGFTGTITVAASGACATLTVQAGATGTLALGTNTLTMTANLTFVTGFHITGTTGVISLGGTATITTGGLAIPNLTIRSSATYTLADDLTVTGTLFFNAGNVVMDGAHDISCANFYWTGWGTTQLVSGKTLTISTAMTLMVSSFPVTPTLRAVTTASAALVNYGGTAANCKSFGITFTDIDASGSAVPILNWYGGTLTRTTNIYTVTSTSFPAVADVETGVGYGGLDDDGTTNRLTGTLDAPTDAEIAEAVWEYDNRTLTE